MGGKMFEDRRVKVIFIVALPFGLSARVVLRKLI